MTLLGGVGNPRASPRVPSWEGSGKGEGRVGEGWDGMNAGKAGQAFPLPVGNAGIGGDPLPGGFSERSAGQGLKPDGLRKGVGEPPGTPWEGVGNPQASPRVPSWEGGERGKAGRKRGGRVVFMSLQGSEQGGEKPDPSHLGRVANTSRPPDIRGRDGGLRHQVDVSSASAGDDRRAL